MTEALRTDASDIPAHHWIDRHVPAPWRPYLRLARVDRPIGTWLLLFPCWWGLALADPGLNGLWFALLFAVGALVMRGAGCTYNDIVDRNFDGKVARTALRPIPSGAISVRQAGVFLGLQLLVGLVVLLQFNGFTIALGVASLALVFTYPLAKRVTHWPQAVLGLTFNWGILVGWSAVHGTLSAAPVLLYAGALFWTVGYDTIYAHQDKEDDVLIGVKSSALRLAAATRPWLFVFYGMAVVLFGAAGWAGGLSWPYYLGLTAAAGHLAWQAATVDIHDPANCLDTFRANRFVGWMLLAGIVAAHGWGGGAG